MTDRKQSPDDGNDAGQEVLEVLEHVRRIEQINADCRRIEQETEQLDRQLRRTLKAWALAIPVFATTGIALLVLTAATVLAVGVLSYTALLAVGLWACHRLYASTR